MNNRYIRPEERIGLAIKKTRAGVRDSQRPTGTEKARTKEVAEQAAVDSTFAKDLAEQLETELGPLPGQVQQALDDAAAALVEAGLARSDAAGAVADAQQAVADAAEAISEALAAASAAEAAQTAADGKSTVVRSPSPATAAGSYKQGDQWWQFSGGNIVGLWLHSGSDWVSQALTNAIIATLDAGKITTGTLAADRIGALSITAAKIAADAITTEKIAALAVTASELAANSVVATKIAASAVIAEKIAAGAVTTTKLDALSVTAEKIAVGAIIAEKIAAGAITTAKLAATAIDGMTITGALIRTAASGQRMQFDVSGLSSFNSSGSETSRLWAGTGGMNLTGQLTASGAIMCKDSLSLSSMTGGTIGTNRIDNTASAFLQSALNNALVGADAGTSSAAMQSITSGAYLDLIANASQPNESKVTVQALTAGGAKLWFTDTLEVGSSSAQTLLVNSALRQLADLPWTQAATSGSPTDRALLRNSWTNQVVANFWDGLQTANRLGTTYISSAVRKASAFSALEVIAILPPRLRPPAPYPAMAHFTDQVGGGRRVDFVLIRPNGEIVPAVGSVSAQTQIVFSASYPS